MTKKTKQQIKSYHVKRCIVKDSKAIRSLLEDRFVELELTGKAIVDDAVKHGYNKLKQETLSRYRKTGNTIGSLTQQDIAWLCYRYGIEFNLVVESIPYNEKESIKTLKKHF